VNRLRASVGLWEGIGQGICHGSLGGKGSWMKLLHLFRQTLKLRMY